MLHEIDDFAAKRLDDVISLLLVSVSEDLHEVEMRVLALCQINGVALELIEKGIFHLLRSLLEETLDNPYRVMGKYKLKCEKQGLHKC